MISSQYVDYIVELAKDVEAEDSIDWGMLSIDEDTTYQLIASNVVDHLTDKYSLEMRDVLLATVVKLVVENFVLNLKLQDLAATRN